MCAGEHDGIGDWYLLHNFLSRTLFFPASQFSTEFTLFLISYWGLETALPAAFQCSGIYLSVGLWTCPTNGNIPQQPLPWQQDETCCVAYFLSANLQTALKATSFQTTAFTCKADHFYIISSCLYFPPFLVNVSQRVTVEVPAYLPLICSLSVTEAKVIGVHILPSSHSYSVTEIKYSGRVFLHGKLIIYNTVWTDFVDWLKTN